MLDQWLNFAYEYQTVFLILGLLSAAGFFCTLIIIPLLITRLPTTYFLSDTRQLPSDRKPRFAFRLTLMFLKNTIALLVLLAGVFMLIVPGQGVLTIILALFLLDFPQKFKLQQWLIQQPSIRNTANWLRKKHNKAPFEFKRL